MQFFIIDKSDAKVDEIKDKTGISEKIKGEVVITDKSKRAVVLPRWVDKGKHKDSLVIPVRCLDDSNLAYLKDTIKDFVVIDVDPATMWDETDSDGTVEEVE